MLPVMPAYRLTLRGTTIFFPFGITKAMRHQLGPFTGERVLLLKSLVEKGLVLNLGILFWGGRLTLGILLRCDTGR